MIDDISLRLNEAHWNHISEQVNGHILVFSPGVPANTSVKSPMGLYTVSDGVQQYTHRSPKATGTGVYDWGCQEVGKGVCADVKPRLVGNMY